MLNQNCFMPMISTKHITKLPEREALRSLWKSISVLDAILSEDWLDRYYTFNSRWAKGEEFGGMRNGQGDELLILFRQDGCVINGMAHNYYPKDKTRLTQGLPEIYETFIFGEPVHSIGTTFCIWTNSENKWQTGQVDSFEDGSDDLLRILDCDPQTYLAWATDYYETEIDFAAVSKIYRSEPLTNDMVLAVNNAFDHWQQLKEDLEEIVYPQQLH